MEKLNRRQWLNATAVGISGLSSLDEMALAFDGKAFGENRSGTQRAGRPRSKMKISSFKATLVASPDFALLNSWNVHDTHFTRTILELETADTHYPWTIQDIIKGPMLQFKDGKMSLPEGPGLGVEIDPDKMVALKENVKRMKNRHDLLKKWDPNYPLDEHKIRW